ncbi:hypothetical protein FHS15_003293 [Paenibacillus castaneae]|uniref:hypothetical protein n=1 Tax=Paenibacillus castaneae TaxID=474957 RepID=UPI000C9CFFB4|nr:hypothetical protein [Paenibacillus castaneae]NIK78155.1 hypothetical protein [Paenibacillus castaneae]
MNHSMYAYGRFACNRLFSVLIIIPLLFAALFAYEAGNNFELTAGSNRFHSVSKSSYKAFSKSNSTTKSFLPENIHLIAYSHALMQIFTLSLTLSALQTSVPQRLRDLLLHPIKFTSHFVG